MTRPPLLPTNLMTILILGGTTEARQLAARLSPNYAVTTSLAGRTRQPADLAGKVRVGGFGGAAGLAAYIVEHSIDLLIDATHPYAARMGHNAALAADQASVPLLRLERPGWDRQPDDRWVEFASVQALATALPGLGQHALVTLGGADLKALSLAKGMALTIRAIDPPKNLPDHPAVSVILDRGPFDLQGECTLMSQRGIDVIVSRNAGGAATLAKIAAARQLGLPVAMLKRPERPVVETLVSVDAMMRRIRMEAGKLDHDGL